jgi:hypothetical protein
MLARVDENTKLVFLCSPNNPTGNDVVQPEQLLRIARALAPRALLVVDEAYIDFAAGASMCRWLDEVPGLAMLKHAVQGPWTGRCPRGRAAGGAGSHRAGAQGDSALRHHRTYR